MKRASFRSLEMFALFLWNEFRANRVEVGSFPNMVAFSKFG